MMRVSKNKASIRFLELADSCRITVLIPARNEEATVGETVRTLLDRYCTSFDGCLTVAVIDDHSTDGTAAAAAKAGAEVITRDNPKEASGKAESIAEGIRRFPSDIYALFDADISNFDATWLELLCAPLSLGKPTLTKGSYNRPVRADGDRFERFLEGGRVTELVARPLLSMFFPELAKFGQPLSGEVAFTKELIRELPLSAGYGFDVGLLLDTYLNFGIGSIVEIELGERINNHESITALSQ